MWRTTTARTATVNDEWLEGFEAWQDAVNDNMLSMTRLLSGLVRDLTAAEEKIQKLQETRNHKCACQRTYGGPR